MGSATRRLPWRLLLRHVLHRLSTTMDTLSGLSPEPFPREEHSTDPIPWISVARTRCHSLTPTSLFHKYVTNVVQPPCQTCASLSWQIFPASATMGFWTPFPRSSRHYFSFAVASRLKTELSQPSDRGVLVSVACISSSSVPGLPSHRVFFPHELRCQPLPWLSP